MSEYTFTLEHYKLFLGDQDSVTGHYKKGFTIHTIEMAVFPTGTTLNLGGMGYYHTRYAHTGFTEYDVDEGDVEYDATSGRYVQILSRKPWPSVGQISFYECELEELEVFPFLSGFFGFEDTEHGTVGYGFEDGFERGYWVE